VQPRTPSPSPVQPRTPSTSPVQPRTPSPSPVQPRTPSRLPLCGPGLQVPPLCSPGLQVLTLCSPGLQVPPLCSPGLQSKPSPVPSPGLGIFLQHGGFTFLLGCRGQRGALCGVRQSTWRAGGSWDSGPGTDATSGPPWRLRWREQTTAAGMVRSTGLEGPAPHRFLRLEMHLSSGATYLPTMWTGGSGDLKGQQSLSFASPCGGCVPSSQAQSSTPRSRDAGRPRRLLCLPRDDRLFAAHLRGLPGGGEPSLVRICPHMDSPYASAA